MPQLLTRDEMQSLYGSFYAQSPKVKLDRRRIPEQFWALIPYAEFWGIADDWTREDLLRKAPPLALRNLKEVVAKVDDDLDEWLAGPEADDSPSDEYIAFSVMRLAAYHVQ